ncbi:MAG: hypothetical protein EOO25_07225 [Comamonadaceae bacterium]|nr:MAG: hypothetical protein EOO25_07225 [Comamonadaceae bacterium]
MWAQVALARGWAGRVASMLAGAPVLRMAVTTPAGSADFRFLREAGEAGFLLSPTLVSTEAAARFFQGESRAEDGVRSLAIRQPDGLIPWYGPRISVRLCMQSWGTAGGKQPNSLLN